MISITKYSHKCMRGSDKGCMYYGCFFFFSLNKRGKGPPKRGPPDVIKVMTKDTDRVLHGNNSRGV